MGQEFKIGTINYLTEDKVVISSDEIVPSINVSQINTTTQTDKTSVSNSSLTTPLLINGSTVSTPLNDQGQIIGASSGGVTVATSGNSGNGGELVERTSLESSELPIIYFNIRSKSFNDQNVNFRFKTSNITSSAGDTTNTWASENSLISGLSLTGDTGCLKVTSAYGKKFYELLSNKSISKNNFPFNLSSTPTYAFLVFALAHENQNNYTLSLNSNQIHRFTNSTYPSNTPIYNIGYDQNRANRLNYFTFALNPLLSPSFISPYQFVNNLNTVFIDNQDFVYYFGQWDGNKTVDFGQSNKINPPPVFQSSKFFNLCNIPNSLTDSKATNTPFIINQGGSDIQLRTFSLFFVEMYSYIEFNSQENNSGGLYNTLNLFTSVNGIQTYFAKILIKPDIDYSSTTNCNLSIANKPGNGNVRMFLFDYLYGNSKDTLSLQKDRSTILESLAYDNKNILLKSSTDLQMTNSTTSLKFPPDLSHPFLNMYFK